ncbi:MAG: DnaJ domain-containing protein [Dehalococcoidia bacterium]|nr:DnaJ domain-containing protein [Dehalococcoidia bacterium]
MAARRDLYQVLTVRRDATPQQIKTAFRKKAMRYHPDHNPGKEAWANRKLKSIIEAYEVLSDPARRDAYDCRLAQAEMMLKSRTTARRSKSVSQYMVDIMRHRATPSWARKMAFAFVFFDYYVKETKKVK